MQEPAENKIVDKPQEISYNNSNKESGYVGFENVKPKSQNSKPLNGMSFLEASKNDSFLKNRYKFGPQFNEWLKKNHDAIKYSGDNTFNNIKNTMEKDVPRFMQDAPFNVDKNGLISSLVKWNLADKAGNKDLKDKAVKNTIGYMSEENQEEYLKDQQPLEDYVKASDDYDHQRGNFKTTEYSTSEPDEDVMKIQNLLVDLDYRNKYDEPIKVDGLAGTNTLYAADTLADEADTIANENSTVVSEDLEPANVPAAQTVDENEKPKRDYAKATSVSRGGYFNRNRSEVGKNKYKTENTLTTTENAKPKILTNGELHSLYSDGNVKLLSNTKTILKPEDFPKIFPFREYKPLPWGQEYFDTLLYGTGTEKKNNPQETYNYIKKKANELGLPLDLCLATVFKESSFRHYEYDSNGNVTTNESNGDYGLMQINSYWHKNAFNDKETYGDIINNWHDNIDYGLMHLKSCYEDAKRWKYTGDDLMKATYSKYNSGDCSAFETPSYHAYQDVKKNVDGFWDVYTKKSWNSVLKNK